MAVLICAMVIGIASASEFSSKSLRSGALVISEDKNSVLAKDADGNSVRISKMPGRVVSCYTSFVSLWYLAGGKLVAMPNTSHSSLEKEPYSSLEKVGGVTAPSLEKILSLKPDLVLLSSRMEKHRATREILQKAGISSILLDYENYSDFLCLADLFSRINGKQLKESGDVAMVIRQIDDLIASVPSREGPRFLSLFASASKASRAETNNANTAMIASLLGGRNIMENLRMPGRRLSVDLSMEKIIQENPDIIFFTTMGDEERIREKMKKNLSEDPVWRSLRAVREHKIHFLPNELFLFKANERYPEAFKQLYNIMHEAKEPR